MATFLFLCLAVQCWAIASDLAHTYRKPRTYTFVQVPQASLHANLSAAQAYSAAERAWFAKPLSG